MIRQRYYTLLLLLFTAFLEIAAAEQTYNVLFIQSYTNQTPWHNDLTRGLRDGFSSEKVKVKITTGVSGCRLLGLSIRAGHHEAYLRPGKGKGHRSDRDIQ